MKYEGIRRGEPPHPRVRLAFAIAAYARTIAFLLFAAGLSLGGQGASVAVDPDCDGMGTVAWSQKKPAGETVGLTLKATAGDGCAFSGWSVADDDVVAWPADLRYPGPLTVTVASNAVVEATFIPCQDDCLSFDIASFFPDEIECGETFSETLDIDSISFPTVTFKNLPSGISYDSRTLTVTGAPKEPGLYRIEANAVNESGFTFRSCATMRVANIEGARVSGIDTEIPLNEYFFSEIGLGDISDIFSFSEDPTSISLTGSVPGLKWDDDWQLLYGTPTDPGEYTLKLKAWFPTGSVETATMTLTVVGGDPEDYDLDLDVLDTLQVGDELDETTEIGADGSESAIASMTGLPTGLAATSRYESGARHWFVSGQVREPGFFTVTVQINDRSGETQRVVKVVRTVTVEDVQDVYLAATADDPERGTVTGGGAVSPFADVMLVATARSGFVFSGWYDPDGERLILEEGVDYRTAEVTLPAGTDFAFLEPVAHFSSKADDTAPDLSELDEAEFSFAPEESFETEFEVESLSSPTLTFRGLPKGVSCAATGSGGFVLTYDPWTAVAASGRYTVTATAVNESGKKSSATFRITVEPRADERINVYDDYGEFTPGEAIDPIDLSDAVDFDNGETLSVSGLPKGLSYNAKANEKKGIEAHTITGTPTVPGDYTLTFTAKVVSGATTNKSGKVTLKYETVSATSFLTVLPYPELEIDVDEDAAAAGCKVTGAGNYKSGTKVTLTATAAKGWVFAGWEGLDDVEGLAALNPKLSYVTGEYDVWAQASFVPVSEDGLYVGASSLKGEGFAAEWPLKVELADRETTLVADLIETVSLPTVKVDGLPSGVKFSASTFLLSGKPTKSGVFHVTVTAKNAGGYSFVRVLDIAVLNKDGTVPQEKALENAAEIDFAPLMALTTGVYCATGAVVLAVGPRPDTGSAVTKVAVSGLPTGLTAVTALADDGAEVEVTGTPTKPGRFVVTVTVSYEKGKSLKSQAAVVVEDGGSRYLFVTSADADCGTVSGEGVYASGATVKLTAKAKSKQVFAGWCVEDEEGGLSLFEPLRTKDGVDPRTPSVSFIFRPTDFTGNCELIGSFAASSEDTDLAVKPDGDVWEIDPSGASSFAFSVESVSLPKVTVSGLPKGVTVDTARGLLSYAPNSATAPGIYTVTLSAKNTTVTKAVLQTIEVRVANRVSDAIGGLDPDMDAYPLSVGTTIDPELIVPTVDEGWKLAVKGLPSGLSYKNGVVTGVPSKAGDYTVTFTATTGSGSSKRTETATITLRVSALPMTLAGTFTGVLAESVDAFVSNASEEAVIGTVSVTATAAGKITATVQTAAKKYSFTAKSWDVFTNGVATVEMTVKGGLSCKLSVTATDDWQSWQATGEVVLSSGTDPLAFEAQRNPYGTKDGFAEARAAAADMAGTSKIDGWTIKVKENGSVAIAGKYEGKSISGSTILQWNGDVGIAQYVKFIDKNTAICFSFVIGMLPTHID